MSPHSQDPVADLEAALNGIRRSQQRGGLQRVAVPGEDPSRRPLTAARFRYLDSLAAAAEGLGIVEVADRIGVDQPRASRLTVELEQLGLVTRTRDPADQRRHRVTLTEAGRALLNRATALRRARVARGLRTLTAAEGRHLADLLTRFLAAWD